MHFQIFTFLCVFTLDFEFMYRIHFSLINNVNRLTIIILKHNTVSTFKEVINAYLCLVYWFLMRIINEFND